MTPTLFGFLLYGLLGLFVVAGALFLTLIVGNTFRLWEWDADDEIDCSTERYRTGQVFAAFRSNDTKELRRG